VSAAAKHRSSVRSSSLCQRICRFSPATVYILLINCPPKYILAGRRLFRKIKAILITLNANTIDGRAANSVPRRAGESWGCGSVETGCARDLTAWRM